MGVILHFTPNVTSTTGRSAQVSPMDNEADVDRGDDFIPTP